MSKERNDTCCFTGYRPEKLPWGMRENADGCIALKNRIYGELLKMHDSGVRHYICGMARGCDLYFAEAVIALRDNRHGITLEAAIPCEGQSSRWQYYERENYEQMLNLCDIETYVSREYTRDCMMRRNRYMVDNSCAVLAVYDGKSGGTGKTLEYAYKRGLQVVILAP